MASRMIQTLGQKCPSYGSSIPVTPMTAPQFAVTSAVIMEVSWSIGFAIACDGMTAKLRQLPVRWRRQGLVGLALHVALQAEKSGGLRPPLALHVTWVTRSVTRVASA